MKKRLVSLSSVLLVRQSHRNPYLFSSICPNSGRVRQAWYSFSAAMNTRNLWGVPSAALAGVPSAMASKAQAVSAANLAAIRVVLLDLFGN